MQDIPIADKLWLIHINMLFLIICMNIKIKILFYFFFFIKRDNYNKYLYYFKSKRIFVFGPSHRVYIKGII